MLVDFLVNDAYNYCVSLSEDELPALPPLTGNAFRKNPCDSPWAVMRFVRTHNGLCLPQIVNTVPLVVERRLCGYHRKPSSNPLSLHTKPSSLREGTASAVEGVFSPAMTTDFAVIANQPAGWCGNLCTPRCHCEPVRTLVWQSPGNGLRFPRRAYALLGMTGKGTSYKRFSTIGGTVFILSAL